MNLAKKKCSNCGAMTSANANFCSVCGNSFVSLSRRTLPKCIEKIQGECLRVLNLVRTKMSSYGIYRESKSRAIGGVCACIAKKLKINVLLVRCIVCSLAWMCAFVVPIYFVIWLITEERKF